jgi:hypothetical protein
VNELNNAKEETPKNYIVLMRAEIEHLETYIDMMTEMFLNGGQVH